jgi:ATP-dependent helicase/nuclease subunit B
MTLAGSDPHAPRAAPVVAPAQTSVSLAPDERWWPAVAGLVCALGGAREDAPLRDLRRVAVIVPSAGDAPALRAALHAALGGKACLAPRIQTLEAWADPDAAAQAPRQRAELFQALRASAWVRERFGDQSSALWSLARDIASLSDELTLAACGAADAFEGRWRAAVQRNFSQRAAAAGDLQAQLVLALWRAGLSADFGAVRLRAGLERRARSADGPLLWLVPQGAAPWQAAYCQAYAAASGHPAVVAVADSGALADRHPWLAAAWPELFRPASGAPADVAPLAERARALRAGGGAPRLQVLRCHSLEQEAEAAAHWTVERLRAGAPEVAPGVEPGIALVALDRLTARRVRALLERAGVLVADESGWKLSTTSAAAAVMGWIDLALSDFEHAALLDWLHSPFTLAGETGKASIFDAVQAALAGDRVRAGRAAVRASVEAAARCGASGAADALRVLDRLLELARPWQESGPLGRFVGLTLAALESLGMRAPLAEDPVGGRVLAVLQELRDSLIGSDLPLGPAEYRAFLAEHFEQSSAGGAQIESPVVMTTLAGTRLRRFGAALLIGADADHLPGARGAGGLLADTVRRELGLRTGQEREREQSGDLAALLAGTPNVAATWRCRRQDEPQPLAPLLERLAMLADLAGFDPLVRDPAPEWQRTAPAVSAPRAPRAPGRLPSTVSAGAFQDLVDCPYRFFALRILGLREKPRMAARPDKRDLGLLLHAILFDFHRGHRDGRAGEATDAQLRARVDAALQPLLEQQPELIGYRQRLRALVPGYLEWQRQAEQDGWRWQDGELSLRRPLEIAPGASVQLQGRVDRVDVDAQGQRRILDYKVRDAASLRKAQREPGEDVQLLFYGLLVDPPPQEAAYVSLQRPPDPLEPARKVVTLIPAAQPLGEQVQALAQRLAADLRRIDAGAPLPANGAESVCRRCELRSLCRHGFTIPAERTAPATPAPGSAE